MMLIASNRNKQFGHFKNFWFVLLYAIIVRICIINNILLISARPRNTKWTYPIEKLSGIDFYTYFTTINNSINNSLFRYLSQLDLSKYSKLIISSGEVIYNGLYAKDVKHTD